MSAVIKTMRDIKTGKKLISAAVILIGVISISLLTDRGKSYDLSPGREITFNGRGVSPDRLVIRLGESIAFYNDSNRPFWPASNLHPTHTIYPEFDPQKPVNPGEKWSFSFNKPGVWQFHDHMAANITGEIVVLSEAGGVVDRDCESRETTPTECFKKDVVSVLKDGGLEGSLDRMAALYDSDPAFKNSCHDVAHILGKEAYHIFGRGGKIVFSNKTSYCGYGFYHGFMEEMFSVSGSVEEAREFCLLAGRDSNEGSVNAEGACYHGIGHGVTDGSDPRSWGDPVALTSPAIDLCDKIDPTEPHFYRCVSGVFNSLAMMYITNSHNLSLKGENPFVICGDRSDFRIKNPCYQEMNTLAMRVADKELSKGVRLVEAIRDEPVYAALAMKSLSGFFPSSFKAPFDDEFDSSIEACHGAREDLVIPCIQGIPSGLMEFGVPGSEYVPALEFCGHEKLSAAERSECYRAAFGSMRSYYNKDKLRAICASIDEGYRPYCLGA